MSGRISIAVATMSGTAEMVADAMGDALGELGRDARVVRMEKLSAASLAAPGTWIICSSTYGTGDVPDNGQALFKELEEARPDLTGLTFAVAALGDSIYPQTFCFGGKRFARLLGELGAAQIGDTLEIDARGAEYPEDRAAAWITDLAEHLP